MTVEQTTTDRRESLAPKPLVEELYPAPDAEQVFRRLACRQHCLFLDSALGDGELGRYSLLRRGLGCVKSGRTCREMPGANTWSGSSPQRSINPKIPSFRR